MPNAQGQYLGDQATVMPDNTAAFMHYSDQFAQLQQQKNLEKAKELKSEQERAGRLQAAINSNIYNPNYLKNDATNPLMREGMDRKAAMAKEINRTKGESPAMDFLNQSAMDLNAGSERIAETNKKMKEELAHYQVLHPTWDGARASEISATNAYFKKDKNGNLVHKELNEINPNASFLNDVINGEHGADLYSNQASLAETNAMIEKEKIEDVQQDQTFNDDGSNKVLGYKGKVPTRLTAPALVDGKMQAVLRNENYKLPNTQPFFLDNTGKSVQVLPKELYSQFYGGNDGFRAGVDKRVKEELTKPVNIDGKGEMNFSPDSDYANMLRQKFAYENLNDQIKNKYSINSVDNSDVEMRKVNAENLANKRYNLSEHRSNMQDLKTNAILNKGSKNEVNTVDIESPLTSLAREKSKILKVSDAINPLNSVDKTVVYKSEIDPKQYNIIKGNEKADNEPVTPFMDNNGKEYFEVNPQTGAWEGSKGQYDVKATKDNLINSFSKDALSKTSYATNGDVINKPAKKGVVQKVIEKVKAAVTPKAAPEKTKTSILKGNVR